MDKIFFQTKLNKIKNLTIRKYFLNFFRLKNILIKTIIFVLFTLIIMGSCFATRSYYLQFDINVVTYNKGFAFSSGSNWSVSVIYLIQVLPSVFALLFFIFVNPPIIFIPLLFISIGGFCNVIDRIINDPEIQGSTGINTVVDYLHAPGSVFNLPDMFVVGGAVIAGINTFGYCLYQIFNENKNEKK